MGLDSMEKEPSYLLSSIPASQRFHVVSLVPSSKPIEKNGSTIYGFFRPMASYSTLADAQNEVRNLAREAPKETFYICSAGSVHPFGTGLSRFTRDEVVLDTNPKGFSPNSEAQKTLLREERILAEELKSKHEELEREDSLAETEGTLQNYIKRRVVTSTLYDNIESLKQKIKETEEKLGVAVQRLLANETQEHVDRWLDVYNAKRKESGLPPHSDSISFSRWIADQRASVESDIQE